MLPASGELRRELEDGRVEEAVGRERAEEAGPHGAEDRRPQAKVPESLKRRVRQDLGAESSLKTVGSIFLKRPSRAGFPFSELARACFFC